MKKKDLAKHKKDIEEFDKLGKYDPKEEARIDEQVSFLKEDRKKFESLGCGFHNGVYYIGTKVFRSSESFPAVVTSDKKLFIKKSKENKRRRF